MTAPAQILSVEDVVARCAIQPRFLKDKRFNHAYLLDFRKAKGTPDYATSVAWRKLLPTEEAVHEYGCRSAAYSNANKPEPPTPLEDAAHYMGFYDLAVKDGMDEANDVYDVHVEQVVENGEDAHCHIVLTELPDLGKDLQKLKGARRSDIFLGIWSKMTGPRRHVCECDLGHREKLLAIRLSSPDTPDEDPDDEMLLGGPA